MTLENVYDKLSSVGVPVAYGHFHENETPKLPYITYSETTTANFYADGICYFHKGNVEVVLRSAEKDIDTEKDLEEALDGIAWEKSEDYDESEMANEITYTFEITE